MSESILDHGYIPEEHAPDPVIGHGDPTPPGKIGIWLFLASEVMFFVAILGSYVVIRAGSSGLFEKHAAVLSKAWAGTNTLVLIFSSLTMALAVDAAQKGNSRRVAKCLAITLLCALAFLGIKTIEYGDKAHHATIVAHLDDPAPIVVHSAAGGPLYAIVSRQNGGSEEMFNGTAWEARKNSRWPTYAVALKARGDGTFAATLPGTAAGYNVAVYHPESDQPKPRDKLQSLAPGDLEAGTGVWLFDGHVEKQDKDGNITLHGYRMPMRVGPMGGALFDIHLLSQKDVQEGGKFAGEPDTAREFEIPASQISDSIRYGPAKNIFYASYFTLTGIHGLHVVGGVIALVFLLVQSLRGRLFPAHTEYVGLYWHFVDLVWIFLFPLLYLI